MSVDTLLAAYKSGIFPWPLRGLDGPFAGGVAENVFWFSPDPRCVLYPRSLHCSRSLRRLLRSGRFEVRFDTAFEAVIRSCAEVRRGGESTTWITGDMIAAYCDLHRSGWAHSIESWRRGRLAGGLYGVAIGKAFFGESMFYREANASKVAFVTLVEALQSRGYHFVDCQQETAHLASFGARAIPRRRFLTELARAVREEAVFPDTG